MDTPKPNKVKTAAKAALQTGLVSLDDVITAVSSRSPQVAGLMKAAQAGIGYYMVYKQEELNEFTQYIQNNPGAFSAEVIGSKEFQDGFIVSLENYFRLRTKTKREIAQEIFMGFAEAPDKPEYPLERFHDTLTKISTHALHTLAFIRADILPFRRAEIEDQVSGMDTDQPDGRSREWWIANLESSEPISKYIHKWLEAKYNFNNPACREEFNLPSTVGQEVIENLAEQSNVHRLKIDKGIGELMQLGLANTYNIGGGWDGGNSGYNLTDYGYEFLDYVPPENP